jgi:S-adenosylmethionine:tRNA ribosyltransferase-isomerase
VFRELPELLPPRSVLVLNDTRVIPARLAGCKPTGGAVEVLLCRRRPDLEPEQARGRHEIWETLAKGLPGGATGIRIEFTPWMTAEVLERRARGETLLRFEVDREVARGVLAAAAKIGEIPLPPYIEAARRKHTPDRHVVTEEDRARYQTVFARAPGAVAAPTAGLHFTPALLDALANAGHQIVKLTLHVGPGTFRPIETDDLEQHHMDPELYELPAGTVGAIEQARAEGRHVVAVGTTVVRALEAAARTGFRPGPGETELFLTPGAAFRVVTDMITNFHLPRSTLLLLVCAFAGRDHVLAAYEEAIRNGYFFYSYGDAMLLRAA